MMFRIGTGIVAASVFAAGLLHPEPAWPTDSGIEPAGAAASTLSQPAPDFKFEATGGDLRSLDDYRGRVVVLNLWATWCPPCIGEIPHLVDVHERIKTQGATIIGLALDSGSADGIVRFWRRTLDLEPAYPLWMGTMHDAEAVFGAATLPVTLLIDREGMIRERFIGMQTAEDLLQALEPYLR